MLVIGIRPAAGQVAHLITAFAEHRKEFAFRIRRLVIPDDVHGIFLLRKRPDRAIKLAAHQRVRIKLALAHRRQHIAVDEIGLRKAPAELPVSHLEVDVQKMLDAARVNENRRRKLRTLI